MFNEILNQMTFNWIDEWMCGWKDVHVIYFVNDTKQKLGIKTYRCFI